MDETLKTMDLWVSKNDIHRLLQRHPNLQKMQQIIIIKCERISISFVSAMAVIDTIVFIFKTVSTMIVLVILIILII